MVDADLRSRLLRVLPLGLRQQPQARRQYLGRVPRVDEPQGGQVVPHQTPGFQQAPESLVVGAQPVPDIPVVGGAERLFHLGAEDVHLQQLADVHHLHRDRPFPARGVSAPDEPPHPPRTPHGGRQGHPLELPARQVHQPLQRHRQLGAPLVGGQLVDLVDDHPTHPLEGRPQQLAGEHDLERLRGGDEHLGRVPGLSVPLRLGGVRVAHPHRQAQHPSHLLDATEHVPVEGPQRCDVQQLEAPTRVLPLLLHPAHQGVEEGQGDRLRLAHSRGGYEEQVVAVQHAGQGRQLGLGGLRDPQRGEEALELGRQPVEGGLNDCGHGMNWEGLRLLNLWGTRPEALGFTSYNKEAPTDVHYVGSM
jgi:hypothetical protein